MGELFQRIFDGFWEVTYPVILILVFVGPLVSFAIIEFFNRSFSKRVCYILTPLIFGLLAYGIFLFIVTLNEKKGGGLSDAIAYELMYHLLMLMCGISTLVGLIRTSIRREYTEREKALLRGGIKPLRNVNAPEGEIIGEPKLILKLIGNVLLGLKRLMEKIQKNSNLNKIIKQKERKQKDGKRD